MKYFAGWRNPTSDGIRELSPQQQSRAEVTVRKPVRRPPENKHRMLDRNPTDRIHSAAMNLGVGDVPTLDWIDSVTRSAGRSFAIDPILDETPVPALGDKRFLNLPVMSDPLAATRKRPSVSPRVLRTLFGNDPLQRIGPTTRDEQTAWLLGLVKHEPRYDKGVSLKSYTPSPSENRGFYLRRILGRRAGENLNAAIDFVDPLTPILDFRHRRKQRIPTGWEDLFLAAGIIPGVVKTVAKGGRKLITVGGGGSLDHITPWEARRIQNAANRTKQEITLVGSRAGETADLTSD